MSRATGKTHYIVQRERSFKGAEFQVLRINPIGQGWGVTHYTDEETANEVRDFLNKHVEKEGK